MRALLAIAVAATLFLWASPVPAIELETIAKAAADYHNPNPRLEQMYRAALLNTSQQATMAPDGTAYVKTGDIPAEWLRDASAQVRPYLFFAKTDPAVASLLRGIIAREGEVPADRPLRQRLHARLSGLGREVRARLAPVSDHAGVDVLEADRR